jgi:hypothetical protein
MALHGHVHGAGVEIGELGGVAAFDFEMMQIGASGDGKRHDEFPRL